MHIRLIISELHRMPLRILNYNEMKFVHEYKEKEYVTFDVATLRNEDQFGHTHTVYATTLEEEPSLIEKTTGVPLPSWLPKTQEELEQ